MTLPKFPDKYSHPSAFTAQDLLTQNPAYQELKLPPSAIITFQKFTYRYLTRRKRGRSIEPPFGDMRILGREEKGVSVVGNFGIGAPVAVFMLEWLAALGVRNTLLIGFSGGLLETQKAGDLVLCSRALRDEGTSQHYLPPAEYSLPDASLTKRLDLALNTLGYSHSTGPTWTTDAPLRETSAEIEHYRMQGILTVEMEAAALFAAAEYLGVSCAAAFAVGDTPKDGRWQVSFDRLGLQGGLERLSDAALAALRGW